MEMVTLLPIPNTKQPGPALLGAELTGHGEHLPTCRAGSSVPSAQAGPKQTLPPWCGEPSSPCRRPPRSLNPKASCSPQRLALPKKLNPTWSEYCCSPDVSILAHKVPADPNPCTDVRGIPARNRNPTFWFCSLAALGAFRSGWSQQKTPKQKPGRSALLLGSVFSCSPRTNCHN